MRILTINTGSSSLRAGLYDVAEDERLLFSGEAERLGSEAGRLQIADPTGRAQLDEPASAHDHAAALHAFVGWLHEQAGQDTPEAVSHRVVHGGREFAEPRRIDARLLEALERLVGVAPDHLPQAIAAIRATGQAYSGLTQIACFDTAFHRRMPPVAQRYALPRRYEDEGIIRFGFHGLSYEFVTQALEQQGALAGRTIIAHLGNGASMAAVRDGVGVDTTMGFTPMAGLVMSTRSGDLDPGILLYLLQSDGQSSDGLNDLLNKQSGLLGVSGSSSDMRTLLEHAAGDRHAAEAVELFCYSARRHIGALTASLGGLEALVFTAGIGERSAVIRRRICAGLEYLGLRLDAARNEAHAPLISADGSSVVVRVVHADENRMLARHAARLLQR